MKPKSATRIRLLLLLFILIAASAASFSQEREMISPYLTFQYFKDTDNHRFLQATLTYSKNRMELPLPGMEILFSTGNSGVMQQKILTGEKGIARYAIDDNTILPADMKGDWNFHASFAGNDSIESASADLTIKDVKLEVSLSMVDSVKTLSLNAKTAEKGKEEPVKGETVLVFVPRMFSLLPVGEGTLDDNGEATVEFPSDLPGDKDGNLNIIAMFQDNPVYGNVEKRISANWGLPKGAPGTTTHRALWTKTAPRWMIIALSILLTGVWAHYLFAIISLIRIKLESKKSEQNNS